jgi:glycerophosphoryl diester phosphodiesterase
MEKKIRVSMLLIASFLLLLGNNGNTKPVISKNPEIKDNVKDIIIVNHRGANRLAPENTYASAKKAIENGATYVEVDVRRSKDGIYYNIHDRTLERTTNGSGQVSETMSNVIDTLDAGGWFGHEFAGERVPRLFEYLRWIKGKAKVYFDMKDVDVKELVTYVYKIGIEKDCFFWFSDWKLAKEFRKHYPALTLKVNNSSIYALDSLKTYYNPQIIECGVDDLSDAFITTCQAKGIKVMPGISGNDWQAYRIAIEKKVDMVLLDSPDVFTIVR